MRRWARSRNMLNKEPPLLGALNMRIWVRVDCAGAELLANVARVDSFVHRKHVTLDENGTAAAEVGHGSPDSTSKRTMWPFSKPTARLRPSGLQLIDDTFEVTSGSNVCKISHAMDRKIPTLQRPPIQDEMATKSIFEHQDTWLAPGYNFSYSLEKESGVDSLPSEPSTEISALIFETRNPNKETTVRGALA